MKKILTIKRDKTFQEGAWRLQTVFKDNDGLLTPLINIIPAIIYAAIITNQFLPEGLTFWQKFGIGFAFVVLYVVVSYLPYVSFITAIASTFMFVMSVWYLCDKAGNQIVRIILKVITTGFVGLLELSIVINRTIRK